MPDRTDLSPVPSGPSQAARKPELSKHKVDPSQSGNATATASSGNNTNTNVTSSGSGSGSASSEPQAAASAPPPAAKVVGPDIFGKKETYQLVRSLQSALFGGVYEASGLDSKGMYAVKVLHKSELAKVMVCRGFWGFFISGGEGDFEFWCLRLLF